ncbi:MAG TPA: DNA repair protein RecO [Candidatus Gallacutalibacter stercoravium]|nr:DNA repair protein RecO [Candidatus Gallacutalibacter stercoravium]
MQFNTDGLVIREQNIGESDRLVTVLTRREGLVRAFVRGAKNLKSRNASSTQLLCYSQMSIYKGKDKYIIDDAAPQEVFFGLRRDIEKLSLAQYFCELALALAPEEGEAGDFLRLMLNALFFLANNKRPPLLIKAVVEMRMLALAGYMPDLIYCPGCGVYEAEKMYFIPRTGQLFCEHCRPQNLGGVAMGPGVVTALRHTVYADFEKVFAFSLPPEGCRVLAKASELYVLNRLERGFQTLDFYHQLVPAKDS